MIIDNVTDPGVDTCVKYCPTKARYIDNITDSNNPHCVSSCPSTAPYYVNNKRCVAECPLYAPYLNSLTCVSTCRYQTISI